MAAWRPVAVHDLLGSLADGADGLVVVAVDGRSAGGKTTLAQRLAAAHPAAALVHTDDVAWNHSFFGWDDVLAAGVLAPARRGDAVTFRPPPWDEHDRPGPAHHRATHRRRARRPPRPGDRGR